VVDYPTQNPKTKGLNPAGTGRYIYIKSITLDLEGRLYCCPIVRVIYPTGLSGRHDTEHVDTQYNDSQHK
jgi:hypothetical protein